MTTLEITVVSVEGLDKHSSSSSSYFTRIRPFIKLTKLPNGVVYQYGKGEHMLSVPVDPTFLSDAYSCLHLQLCRKRRIVGPTQLGWCLIPTSDIDIGLLHLPSHSLRFLSYRLRATDGSKCPLIIRLSIRLISSSSSSSSHSSVTGLPLLTLDAYPSSKSKMDFEIEVEGQSQSHLIGGGGTTSQYIKLK